MANTETAGQLGWRSLFCLSSLCARCWYESPMRRFRSLNPSSNKIIIIIIKKNDLFGFFSPQSLKGWKQETNMVFSRRVFLWSLRMINYITVFGGHIKWLMKIAGPLRADCLLCIARFDDGKWYAVLSALTKCHSPVKVSSWVIFPVLVCFLSTEHSSALLWLQLMTWYCHGYPFLFLLLFLYTCAHYIH